MARTLRIAVICILALTIVLSCTVGGNTLTDPATYSHTIGALDRNRTTVLALSAASAAASAAVSALPDDVCSPLAQEISEFTTWFLMILSVIYLEKYLLTIFGAAACFLLLLSPEHPAEHRHQAGDLRRGTAAGDSHQRLGL